MIDLIREFKVSIRCMTYNQKDYITDALDGFAIQQTDFPFVAIIMDDASTEGEPAVIESYLEKHFSLSGDMCRRWETEEARWVFAQHKENLNCFFVVSLLKRNLYKQRWIKSNLIKEWEEGTKYIALCEGDDYWTDPLKLQRQVEYMEEHQNCCMTACAANWEKNGAIFKNDRVSDESRDLTTEEVILGGGGYLATCSLVYNNDKLNKNVPKWRKIANVGDYPLMIQGTMSGDFHYFPETMCVYRCGVEGSWTSRITNNEELGLLHRRKEITWMQELDKDTMKKHQCAIYQHLKPYFRPLYLKRMVSTKEYMHFVYVAGNWKDCKWMIKNIIKRFL